MTESLKQELLESTMVDVDALNSLEKSDLQFDTPLWMLVMIALVFALAGVQAVKLRTSGEKEIKSNKK